MVRTLALVAGVILAAGADWPQWRGPDGRGLAASDTLPLEWGEGQNVAWKVAVPGKGWSSPVVGGGKIYLTTAVPAGAGPKADQSLRALALDAATGRTLWDVEVFAQVGAKSPKIHAKNSHASATPFLDGDRLFVHFGHLGTACLSAADGSTVWQSQKHPYEPIHGNGGSPVVWRDHVVIQIDSPTARKIVAFDKGTGAVAWEHERSQRADRAFSFGTPIVATIDGQETLIGPGSDVVNALDPATGKELWAVTYSGFSMVPRPVFAHGMIFMSTGFETPSLIAIRAERTASGWGATVAWRAKADAPASPSPVVLGDELYMVSDTGIASCLDAKTGKVHWRERVPGGYTAALLAGAGRVYLQNESGVGTVLKAGTEFESLATNKLDGRTLASYAVDGEALLIRTETHLYRVK